MITNKAKVNESEAFNDETIEELAKRLLATKAELNRIIKDKKDRDDEIARLEKGKQCICH